MDLDQERDDSVFDFVYVDRLRLASLLAQLSDDGVVSTAKRTSSTSGSNSGDVKLTAAVVSVNGSINDVATEALERSFDASMLLPINALTVLQESGLLHRGLLPDDDRLVPLGGLVHLEGFVALRDIDMVRRLWQPMTGAMVDAEHPSSRKAKRAEVDLAWKILKDLPSTTHFTMLTIEGMRIWGLLNGNDPTFSTHDMGLKHGSTLQGQWHLIAILDAYPEGEEGRSVSITDGDGFLSTMAPMIDEYRKIMGRPLGSFGVTPLAIFRPINYLTEICPSSQNDADDGDGSTLS